MATRVARFNGLPSVKILVPAESSLPDALLLPTPSGSKFMQKVVYVGLSNQCFVCKKEGHLAWNCPDKMPDRMNTPTTDSSKKDHEPTQETRPSNQEWRPANKHGDCTLPPIHERGIEIPLNNTFGILSDCGEKEGQQEEVYPEIGKEKRSELVSDLINPCCSNVNNEKENTAPIKEFIEEIEVGLHCSTKRQEGAGVKKRTMQARQLEKGKEKANMQANKAINIRTMRVQQIEGMTTSFRLWDTEAKFPSTISNLFGNRSTHDPTTLRIHVILQPGMNYDITDSPLGFSFPLCGFGEVKKIEQVKQLIGEQVVFFSKYYGSSAISSFVETSWSTSVVSCIQEPDQMGTYHLLFFINNCPIQESGYLYIHNDNLSEGFAADKGHHHWHFIRARMMLEVRNNSSVCMESESMDARGQTSPPIEPNPKHRRRTENLNAKQNSL